jgi:hypothetical protein
MLFLGLLFLSSLFLVIIVTIVIGQIRKPEAVKILCGKIAGLVLAFVILLGGCHGLLGPLYYRAEGGSSAIIDGNSGHPIAGARVHVQWMLTPEGLHPSGRRRLLHESHAVSDANGRFEIQPMPRRMRPFFWHLDADQPVITIEATGYPVQTETDSARRGRWSLERSSSWSGKVIRLYGTEQVER